MKKKKNILLFTSMCIIAIVSTVLWVITHYYIIVKQTSVNKTVGIIDGNRISDFSNVIYNGAKTGTQDGLHGDLLLSFIDLHYDGVNVFYYDAGGEDSFISAEEIIAGLEWMLLNDIREVNISLSSKEYSAELDNWISEHSSEIIVYASFNNLKNSYDYPAMLPGVVASGMDPLEYKEGDIIYKKNRFIFLPSFKKFEGNSFLSLVSMIEGGGR